VIPAPEKRKVGGSTPPLTTHLTSGNAHRVIICALGMVSFAVSLAGQEWAANVRIMAGPRFSGRRSSAPKADGSTSTCVHRRLGRPLGVGGILRQGTPLREILLPDASSGLTADCRGLGHNAESLDVACNYLERK
jgi:hypothetical protein